jgi:hypothetical protein
VRLFPNGSENKQSIRNRTWLKLLKRLERVKGIEPSYSAWKAAALPLSYTRIPIFFQILSVSPEITWFFFGSLGEAAL